MTVIPNTEREAFDIDQLNPRVRAPIDAMVKTAGAKPFMFRTMECIFAPFEGYRSPVRQHHLFTVDKTTKVGPWKSAHQYGLAVDFAVLVDFRKGRTRWSWPIDAPWSELKLIARQFGLDIPIEWDRGHVVHPLWYDFKKLL